MAEVAHTERLSPLDLLMPSIYIRAVLVFNPATAIPATEIQKTLQQGLGRLSKQVPWLPGRLYATTSTENARALEIRTTENDTPTLVDKGSVSASYKDLASRGMLPEEVPDEIWPVPSMTDDASLASGAPVFAASLFRFADEGLGLCLCIHHAAVDATGFSEVVRLWVQNLADATFTLSLSAHSTDTLLARHPEYSRIPPSLPTEFPASTSRLFRIPIHWINVLKELLGKRSSPPTTNTILCALIWTSITRVRLLRTPSRSDETRNLVTAVNGRPRLNTSTTNTFSTAETPYLGNAVLYSLTKNTFQALATADTDPISSLREICTAIATSQSPTKINSQHIAEVHHLVESRPDPRGIFVGWDLFGSKDLTITSWADADVYGTDFGRALGAPVFVRFPYMEADGVAIVLPRKSRGTDGEVLEVVVVLRRDDMDALEGMRCFGPAVQV
ncbi:transferase family-domain-containing protein [Aspergillus carlsbadensis]|nr:transferase family-domain-containing protein [Aspergillus carlsbadensis]